MDMTGIMALSPSNSNAQQQQLPLPPSVTSPIQHLSEPSTTPSSTSLNPSAANCEGQADLGVASPIDEDGNFPMDEDRNSLVGEDRDYPMDEDRYSFANELANTLNTAFTGAHPRTINPLALHDFPNDSGLNNTATHSTSCSKESTLIGLIFRNLDDGQWDDGDDSDASPNCRNPQGALLDYMEIHHLDL